MTNILPDPAANPAGTGGTSVLIAPTRFAIGAPLHRLGSTQGQGLSCGAVYLWARTPTGVPTGLPTTVTPVTPYVGERFGEVVAASSLRLLVASPGWGAGNAGTAGSAPAYGRGRVHIFLWTPGGVTPEQILQPGLPAPTGDEFGAALAIDEPNALVGAPGFIPLGGVDNVGRVFVFTKLTNLWASLDQIDPPIPRGQPNAAGARFGTSVAITSDRYIVGAPSSPYARAGDSGRVFVYDRANLSRGPSELSAPSPTIGDWFGTSIAVSGDLLAIGAPGCACGVGAVHIFQRVGEEYQWTKTIDADPALGASGFGSSVALDHYRLAIGTGGIAGDPGAQQLLTGTRAEVWRRSGLDWVREFTVEGAFGEISGAPVQLNAAGALVGAPELLGGCGVFFSGPRWSDLDFDGQVGAGDLAILLGDWGQTYSAADLDADGIVGAEDLANLLGAWDTGGSP
ncbi:MAG: hypothetical protein U0572_10275 [Phycisphaerales bacterium]